MDIKKFLQILNDGHFSNYKKMKYKYGADFDEFLSVLEEAYYFHLPICDFDGKNTVFLEEKAKINQNAIKALFCRQEEVLSAAAAENEIVATGAIENIDFARESVRKILKGMAPTDEQENRILGLKQGLQFIADTQNKITEENLHRLYMLAVGNFLSDSQKLIDGNFYRHDSVFVVGDGIEHVGLQYQKIPKYMSSLISFINTDDNINDLVKGAVIHFYIAYIHPYFDGNGRMARLVHLWFLLQKGYQSALFVPFSQSIEKSRKAYYDAFTAVEENKKVSGRIDITPFIMYFSSNVYDKITESRIKNDTLSTYANALKKGEVTKKEASLWQFVLSQYGTNEFSTKQLEKDFGDVAYATVRGFVQKFERLGLLSSTKYGTRVAYKIKE